MKYFICFTLRANISASDYFTKWVSEDQLEIRSLITASVRSIFRTDMQYYNQRWNVCRNYNKYKSWWYVAKLEYIFKYFHAFSNFYESVRRGYLKKKEKPFPSRTSLNFKIRVHWTLGDPKGGSASLPSPVPKKRGGVREGSLSRNWKSETFTTEERIVHSRSDRLLVWKWNLSIMITLITLDHINYHTKREYYHLLTMFYPSLVLICL